MPALVLPLAGMIAPLSHRTSKFFPSPCKIYIDDRQVRVVKAFNSGSEEASSPCQIKSF